MSDKPQSSSASSSSSSSPSAITTWSCGTCTLLNDNSDRHCIACERPNPANNKATTKSKPKEGSKTKAKVKENDDEKPSPPPPKKTKAKAEAKTKAKPKEEEEENDDDDSPPPPSKKAKKLRQATEKDGIVEILCCACRHDLNPKQTKQSKLGFFFQQTAPPPSTTGTASIASGPVCGCCLKPLTQPTPTSTSTSGPLEIISRLRGYKKIAKDNNLPFTLTSTEALNVMRSSCTFCGVLPAEKGHGITRLKIWPPDLLPQKAKCKKPYMGPFCTTNVRTSCAQCNLSKGARSLQSYIEACRHIATHNTLSTDAIANEPVSFGLYPHRFRDNVSKRSRSSYITESSTHTKTHTLTNVQFNEITSRPCHYCGKTPRAPVYANPEEGIEANRGHFNGLDRLSSSDRVYAIDTVVSCCGDCNGMKYKFEVDGFLGKCLKVAQVWVDYVFDDEEVVGVGEEDGGEEIGIGEAEAGKGEMIKEILGRRLELAKQKQEKVR